MTNTAVKRGDSPAGRILTLPDKGGRLIVESGALIACPLLGTDKFITFCCDRAIPVDRERLLRLERLGLFAPVFRVRTPKKPGPTFHIPVRKDNNWFTKRWAWDTTGIDLSYEVPTAADNTQEGYYSIFQINYLDLVLSELTINIHMDSYMDGPSDSEVNWEEKGNHWLDICRRNLNTLRKHEYRRAVSLLCQFISERYYPHTQGDQRTIQLNNGHSWDGWVSIRNRDQDWYEIARTWDPHAVERLFRLTPEKLRHAYTGLAGSQAHNDPLQNWYQLIQFVAVSERKRLKGQALRAETLRSGALMLRLLYRDLYGEELPHPNEVHSMVITPIPELAVRQDVRRYLEFVTNHYGLNPQPRLALIVEGKSEQRAVEIIFEKYFGAHPGTYGIEIVVLGGVDVATGSKEDRFRAILRLIDYLHHHQTITFLMLDNENYASKLKHAAQKAKSIHSDQRYVTRPDYIRVWNELFEFDNFSCTEIAEALSQLSQGRGTFVASGIVMCKKDKTPGARLNDLYRSKLNYDIDKPKLSGILVERMLSGASRRQIESRPIIKTLEKVASLAARNPLPTMQATWELNQASKYLGKKRDRKAKK